jgi:hypothetical protein
MKKILNIFTILTLFNISLLAAGNISQSYVKQYIVNFKKIELYNSTSNKWIQVSKPGQSPIDIAGVNPNQSIGAMMAANAALTFGTYTKSRATIGNTFTIQACNSTNNACTDNTKTGNAGGVSWNNGAISITGGHTAAIAWSTIAAAAASPVATTINFSNVTLPTGASLNGSDVMIEHTLTAPFIINKSSKSPNINVTFDVNNVLKSTTLSANLDGNGNNEDWILLDFPIVHISIN